MDFTSFVNTFDLFADCYVYGCVAYVIVLFTYHLFCSFLNIVDERKLAQPTAPDFYQQVQELFNPSTTPNFEIMTIRELRAYIKEHRLHKSVQDTIGKSVTDARKSELIASLKTSV
jgi:hypothetical protein